MDNGRYLFSYFLSRDHVGHFHSYFLSNPACIAPQMNVDAHFLSKLFQAISIVLKIFLERLIL